MANHEFSEEDIEPRFFPNTSRNLRPNTGTIVKTKRPTTTGGRS